MEGLSRGGGSTTTTADQQTSSDDVIGVTENGDTRHSFNTTDSSIDDAVDTDEVDTGTQQDRNSHQSHRLDSKKKKSMSSSEDDDSSIEIDFENDDGNDDDEAKEDEDEEDESEGTTVLSFLYSFQQARHNVGQFVNHPNVQLFVVLLIALNGLMMGVGTYDIIKGDPVASDTFEKIDQVFLIIFTIELALQFFYHGIRLFLDGWLIFDFVIILISWSFAEVQIVRAFRIFRALRLVTRVKILKNLVLALLDVIPRMCAIGLLLFLISYIFAVMFTQLFKDLYEDGHGEFDYFGRMDKTLFTLSQIMTLDSWAKVAREVMTVYSWAWLPFIVFVILTGFVVVNLIIAVICDAVSALEEEDKARLHGTFDATTASEQSLHPANTLDLWDQINALELHVQELTRMQEDIVVALTVLSKQIQSLDRDRNGGGKRKKNDPTRLLRKRE